MKRSLAHGLLAVAAFTSATLFVAPHVQAQAYPSKTIRIIMPFPPGGATDIQGRILSDKLSPRLGQQMIIDSRPGANGRIGMELAARAPADGYNLVIATSGNWAVHPHLYELPYDTLKDFVHIVLVASTPGVLVVHPTLPVKNVKELIALAKKNPGELTYGSSGVGGFAHISAELFNSMAGTKMTHVPYKGSQQSLIDLMAGHIQLSFNIVAPSMGHIKAGRVKPLAVTTAKRVPQLPQVPTVAEGGVRGYENETWSGIGAPAGTPQPVVERLSKEFQAALSAPDVREKLDAAGSVPISGTPAQFRDYLQRELAKYGKLVKGAGIKAGK
ncbi:MAG TPA: tripartite tricarboxylate transporter substrate binding protein [Burkholderiales bacterium]|nr:tripartite tricarboxylate transporter substrate binding protein [Burkholderiales bacterium]